MNFKDFDAVIDARTPAEYALDHIPGAVSAPVLDDAQRAEVGTLYKQVSPFDAKKLGAALIAHRGSVLGSRPNEPQPSQKWFESQLLSELEKFDRSRPVYVEAESKKIGQIQVPEALMERMRASRCMTLETDLATRVTLLP